MEERPVAWLSKQEIITSRTMHFALVSSEWNENNKWLEKGAEASKLLSNES